MKYTESYKTENDLIRSQKPAKEAYKIAKAMYEPHWGRENNKKCLTKEDLPIVYAFNLDESIKNDIIAAGENFHEVIARESMKLSGSTRGILFWASPIIYWHANITLMQRFLTIFIKPPSTYQPR